MKKVLSIFLVIIITFGIFSPVTYAKTLTKENLENAFNNIKKELEKDSTEAGNIFSIDDNYITIASDDITYKIAYDLTDKPTFTYETTITNSMTYDEFEERIGGLTSVMYGYLLVLYNEGVSLEDAMIYYVFSMLGSSLGNIGSSSDDLYMIIDDRNTSEGVEIIKDPNDTTTIYASEFTGRAVEYIDSIYKEPVYSYSDSELNSYQYKLEKITEGNNRKLRTSLTVNLDADLSKINGYADSIGNAFEDMDVEEMLNEPLGSNNISIDNNQKEGLNVVSKIEDNTINNDKIEGSTDNPGTGIKNNILIVLGVITLSILGFLVNKKYIKNRFI